MRIAIVNDVPVAVEALRRTLARRPRYQVSWIARSGEEAVAMCAQDRPDLVLMDLVMPGMGGVEATRRIMKATPCPILIVAASVTGEGNSAFEAMGHGALDAVEIPVLAAADRDEAIKLLDKIESVRRRIAELPGRASVQARPSAARCRRLVAFGASAGGPAALARIFADLSPDLPAGLLVIQHVDAQFALGMADWLSEQCTLRVRVARDGDVPEQGTVLLAGTSDHMVIKPGGVLTYTPEPLEYVYRPSVDVFFHSLVQHWQGEAVGVLLTGMGRDGARGLKALRDKGHHTIAQDQATSAVYGMPKAAAGLDAAVDVLPLSNIATRLNDLVRASLERG